MMAVLEYNKVPILRFPEPMLPTCANPGDHRERPTGVKVPKLNPVSWATDLLTDAEEWAVIICGIWVVWMPRNKQKHGEL